MTNNENFELMEKNRFPYHSKHATPTTLIIITSPPAELSMIHVVSVKLKNAEILPFSVKYVCLLCYALLFLHCLNEIDRVILHVIYIL